MELINNTPYTAALYRSQIVLREPAGEQEYMHNSLVVCCRYPLDSQGRLGDPAAAVQRATPEPDGPDDPAYGTLCEPGTHGRAGTDVIVLGDAIAPGGATRAQVHLQVGPYDERFAVIGDRVWTSRLGILVPSKPARFVRMPLTWARAYGGVAQGLYGPMPCPANPRGCGYYLSRAEADGQPLPNVEDPNDLVTKWSDRPAPVGCGPYPWGWALRLLQIVDCDAATKAIALHPERGMFDQAHPRLSGRSVQGGPFLLKGMHAAGAIRFVLPPCPVIADIEVGPRTGARELNLEEIRVDLLRSCVDLTWRKGFKYLFEPHLTRKTIVRGRD